MDELIQALQIFSKYTDKLYPTGCEHDELYVYVSPDDVSEEDITLLDALGFVEDRGSDRFYSFKYGSA